MDKKDMDRFLKAFAAELRAARGRAALSRTELARKSGVSLSSLNRHEAGLRPIPLPELNDVCEVLGVEPEQIFHAAQRVFRSGGPSNA